MDFSMERPTERFLRLSETYTSLQGEGAHTGLPCFFIRTGGCDLRCSWCDTPHALSGGQWIARDALLALVPSHVRLIQLTGGEPLLQRTATLDLCRTLAREPFLKKVILETGGHLSLKDVPDETHIVMDIKLPGSGEPHHPFADNFPLLKQSDEIKFVVRDFEDFRVARHYIEHYKLERTAGLLFSPVWGQLELADLAAWLLQSGIQARLQTQLHKYIWGPAAIGV